MISATEKSRIANALASEVRAWVLGWGADVEVLAPPALRDEVHEHAARMVGLYKGIARDIL